MRGRDDCVLEKNHASTDIFKFSFFNRIVDMWNALPPSTRCAPSITVVSSSKWRISWLLDNLSNNSVDIYMPIAIFTFLIYSIIPFSFFFLKFKVVGLV